MGLPEFAEFNSVSGRRLSRSLYCVNFKCFIEIDGVSNLTDRYGMSEWLYMKFCDSQLDKNCLRD